MNIETLEQLYQGAVSASAAKRILQAMGFTPSKIDDVTRLVDGEKVQVVFRQQKQKYEIDLTAEHFLGDYFRERWQKSFDYSASLSELADLALISQGGDTPEYWVKIHAPGRYECDCPDWIAQHEKRGVAVCKHAIRLAYLQEVSIAEMLAAQTVEADRREVA